MPSNRPPRAPHPAPARPSCCVCLALALSGALPGGPALAADTSWTGGAGPAQPFWDLAGNWSAGVPAADTTRALLGAADTTLRSGSFAAASVQGSGTLALLGGELRLAGGPSALGRLDMRGGHIGGGLPQAPLALDVQALDWSGGSLGALWDDGLSVSVAGRARLSGRLDGNRLRLLGDSRWDDAPAGGAGGTVMLDIGPGGRLQDHAARSDHGFSFPFFNNDGTYLKTGTRTTTITMLPTPFANRGQILVREGTLKVAGDPAGLFTSSGAITVDGGHFELDLFRWGLGFSGRVDVLRGAMSVDRSGGIFDSSADWQIGPGGRLHLTGRDEYAYTPIRFRSGRLRNDGLLQIDATTVEAGPGVLGGSGRVELLHGSILRAQGDVALGTLSLHEPYYDPQLSARIYAGVTISGSLTVDRLDWLAGPLDTGGPVTVRGPARLAGGEANDPYGAYYKRIERRYDFQGGADWAGDTDLRGGGEIHVAAGTVFRDRVAAEITGQTPDEPLMRPVRLAVAAFHNDGTYLKTGPGPTQVDSRFVNRGTLRALDAGTMSFLGGLASSGTIEARRSRIEVAGDFANEGALRLAGGELRVDGGAYRQAADDAATWADGRLQAQALHFDAGRFGAGGAAGEVGRAVLQGTTSFADALRFEADIAGAALFDVVQIGGTLQLGGRLLANFLGEDLAFGHWRLITADGGLSGRFASLASNLDPALYRLGAVYGADFMELTVSPVPEPATCALTALGLAGLAGRRRRAA